MKLTNIGVQLFPLGLLGIGFCYHAQGVRFLGYFCFVLAIVMWFVLLAENIKHDD